MRLPALALDWANPRRVSDPDPANVAVIPPGAVKGVPTTTLP
jgi:hypothetical protein